MQEKREEATFLHELSHEQLIGSLVEIELVKPDNFLIIKETLTRVGVQARDSKTLFQSCHIFTKRNKLYIVHFKELFALDGREVSMTKEDYARRNYIANILKEWKLINIHKELELPFVNRGFVTVVPHSTKSEWDLKSKYTIGGVKKQKED